MKKSVEMNPMISILVPVYNRESYIGECIQSALDQTYKNFELIIVDNASTDGTWNICQHFASLDARVKLFRNSVNVGPVRNWRRCIEEAKGEYGKILFSDDSIASDFLEKTIPALMNSEVGFVFSSVNIGSTILDSSVQYKSRRKSENFSAREFISDSLLGDGDVPVSPGAALFRMIDLNKFLIEDIKSPSFSDFYQHGAGPDILLFLLVANQYPQVAYIREPLAFFRVHSGSISMEGANTIMHSRYFQAKIWFANEYFGQSTLLRRILCRAWLDHSMTDHKPLRFSSVVNKYLFKEVIVRRYELIGWIGVEVVKRAIASMRYRMTAMKKGC